MSQFSIIFFIYDDKTFSLLLLLWGFIHENFIHYENESVETPRKLWHEMIHNREDDEE